MDFYTIDENYLDYLRQFEKHIYYTKGNKTNRKFVGIVLEINNIKYYAPLTHIVDKSYKTDFIICNNNNEKIATVKLNNMIPIIDMRLINKVDINIYKTDSEQLKKYKSLLKKEKKYIDKHIDILQRIAKQTYRNYQGNIAIFDFNSLEQKAKLYTPK